MKKTIILISIASMFISSCSLIEDFMLADPTPIPPTPMPTATPDPCAAENLVDEIAKVQDLVNAFQDIWFIAISTNINELVIPILDLVETRRELQKLEIPNCLQSFKTASIDYMNSTISYLTIFMSQSDESDWESMRDNSDLLWQVVLGEYRKLLTSAGLVSEELPDIGMTTPPTTESDVFVGNESTQGVNVRSQPDLNADIIAQLEPGMQAIGLARNESGDWLLINLDDVIGWVYTETVTTSAVIEGLPISDPDQTIEE